MISVNNYPDKVLSDFIIYLDDKNVFVNLKSANYDLNIPPDYEVFNNQQNCLLRYASANAFEYKKRTKYLNIILITQKYSHL